MPYQDTLVSLMNIEVFREIVGTDLWRRMDLIHRTSDNAANTSKNRRGVLSKAFGYDGMASKRDHSLRSSALARGQNMR